MSFSDETISIIIPTYYRNDLLQEAIESVLQQEYDPIEVIVVDDSGEAHAEPAVKDYDEVTYIPLEENLGENPARDAGLDVATGSYIQFLDDDDLLRKDKLRRQIALLDEETGVVYSGLQYHESEEIIRPNQTVRGNVLEHTLKFEMWPPCFTSAMLIDRDVLEQVRPLNYHGAGDTTFMIGLARRTYFDFVDAPLVEKRLAVDSLGFSKENVDNKKQLLDDYDWLYNQFPRCRKAALTHIYREEGRVRLSESTWDPVAIIAFARAAYHAPTDQPKHLGELFGALFGQIGVRSVRLTRRFAELCRKEGPTRALGETKRYLRSD